MHNGDGVSACCFLQLLTLWRFKRKWCWFGHILFRVTTIIIFHSAVLGGPSICILPSNGFKISYLNLSISATDFFLSLRWPCMYTMWYFFVSQGFPMFLVWQHPSNHVTLFLFQLQVFVLLCFVSIFSVWRCPWAVLRPDEAFWGGGFPAKHTLSIFGRLCGSRLFQYWGECYSVMIAHYVK